MEIKPDGQLVAAELPSRRRLVKPGVNPATDQSEIVDEYLELEGIELGARISRRANDASPVGIAPGNGGLYQWGIGDSTRDPASPVGRMPVGIKRAPG